MDSGSNTETFAKVELVIAMKAKSDEGNQWEPCPPGELARIAGDLRRRRRTRIVTRVTTATAVLLVMAVGGAYFTSQFWNRGDYDFGGITCTEVKADIPLMAAGKLDQETMMRIQKHLELCPKCKPLAEQMQDQMPKMQKGMKMSRVDCHDPNCPCARHDRLVAERDTSWQQRLVGMLAFDREMR